METGRQCSASLRAKFKAECCRAENHLAEIPRSDWASAAAVLKVHCTRRCLRAALRPGETMLCMRLAQEGDSDNSTRPRCRRQNLWNISHSPQTIGRNSMA